MMMMNFLRGQSSSPDLRDQLATLICRELVDETSMSSNESVSFISRQVYGFYLLVVSNYNLPTERLLLSLSILTQRWQLHHFLIKKINQNQSIIPERRADRAVYWLQWHLAHLQTLATASLYHTHSPPPPSTYQTYTQRDHFVSLSLLLLLFLPSTRAQTTYNSRCSSDTTQTQNRESCNTNKDEEEEEYCIRSDGRVSQTSRSEQCNRLSRSFVRHRSFTSHRSYTYMSIANVKLDRRLMKFSHQDKRHYLPKLLFKK